MKKLGFTGQLFILFASILLIATIAFSAITITSVRAIAYDEVYSRLSSYSAFILLYVLTIVLNHEYCSTISSIAFPSFWSSFKRSSISSGSGS